MLRNRFPMYYTAQNGFPAVCEISVFFNRDVTTVVITNEDVGPSVTNNAEVIIKELESRGVKFDFAIEHYRADPIRITRRDDIERNTETWDFVNVDHDGKPIWMPATRETVESMIGMPYPD